MEDRLIQPIVLLVDKADPGNHFDAVVAVAMASVAAYADQLGSGLSPMWEPWLGRSYAKTVRRADRKAFERIAGSGGQRVSLGSAQAIAFTPTTYSHMPKILARLQVSGTELPRRTESSQTDTADVRIVLNAGLGMSTGKTAAQAAHALFAWFRGLNVSERRQWFAGKFAVAAVEVGGEEFARLAQDAIGPVIVDSGFTEISPNTPTAFILRSAS